jgi:hypothetical protein
METEIESSRLIVRTIFPLPLARRVEGEDIKAVLLPGEKRLIVHTHSHRVKN